ncbi:Probable serine/threonine-protein kinase At1g54610 [Linum perenne]
MGAAQGKGHEKLNLENGLPPARRKIDGQHRRSLGPHHRNSGRRYGEKGDPRPPMRTYTGGGFAGGGGGGSSGERKQRDVKTRDRLHGSEGGGGSEGDPLKGMDPFGVEETVDGWPKWLADNVPMEVLSGVVKKSAEDYDKLDKVGSGTYSNVYKARDRDSNKIVALKKVRFDTSEPESVKFMAREIMILQKLDHPNVVKLEGIATSRLQYSLYLVFDFMQTDLQTVISQYDRKLTEPQVKSYMQQLLSGLQHCHDRGILHRDIKGANLLIDKHGMLKIADFGLANYYSSKRKQPLTSRVVTLWYRAPELLLGSTDYGVGIDLWSAGCLMAEMFSGRPIMPGRTEVEQLHRIFKLCGTPSDDYWKKLRLSTTFRPPQVYKPNLIKAFRDFPESSFGLFTTLLALDPDYRGSAHSALKNQFFYSSPLACDLSGLPVIRKKEDEQANDQRKSRNSNGHRSRKQQERRRKEAISEMERPDDIIHLDQDPEIVNLQHLEAGSSSTTTGGTSSSSSSGVKQQSEKSESSPAVNSSKQKLLLSPEDSPPARSSRNRNTKNLPPLPISKTSSIRYVDDDDDYDDKKKNSNDMYRFRAAVQRSASSREYTKLLPRKHIELYATEE